MIECDRYNDAFCFNGTCIKDGRCNKISDCDYGEDEYMCEHKDIKELTTQMYRKKT